MSNAANFVTLFRIVLAPLFVYFFYIDKSYAILIFCLAAISDFLDGFLARKYNIETSIGKLLDPIADKLITFAALFVLNLKIYSLYFFIPSLVLVTRDVYLSVLRILDFIFKRDSNIINVTNMAKFKSLLLFLALLLLLISFEGENNLEYLIAVVLLYASSGLTVVTLVTYLLLNSTAESR